MRERRNHIRCVASALVLSGTDLESIETLASIVTPQCMEQALTFMWERNGDEFSGYINKLASTMLLIARHYVGVGADVLKELQSLCAQTKLPQVGFTSKNLERLLQFREPRNTAMLLDLPNRLHVEAQRRGEPDEKAALLMQSAIAVELLLMCMLRRKNLVNLDERSHIRWSRAVGKRVSDIVIEADEVKNQTRREFELPPRSAALLRLYMERYQPLLGTCPSSWLFPGRYGKAKNASGMSVQIADTVFSATGIKMHVHLFRHVGAMLYLERNPGGYEVLRRIFGHKSVATTIATYCGLEMIAAAKHFDAEILAHGDATRLLLPQRRTNRSRTMKKGNLR